MPTLKKRSGKASRNGRMSVYLPRSAVRPTIAGRSRPSLASAWPNGASTEARLAAVASSCPMARVRAGSAIRCLRRLFELADQRVPLPRLDPDEMRLLALLQRRHALARQRTQHDRLRAAASRPRPLQRRDDRRNVVAVDLLRLPAEGAPLIRDRLHVEDDAAVGLDAVAVDQRDEIVETEARAGHRRLPGGALLHLAIGELDENPGLRAVESKPEGLADALPEAVAERAADDLDPGRGVERAHLEPA